MSETSNLSVAQWVEIRSKDEILKTLDKNGRLDGMPFMPEMFEYCGQRFPIYRRAHKGCDTVYPVRSRRITNAVHLETRCSGQHHAGCQAACLLYWKEAWLKPVDAASNAGAVDATATVSALQDGTGCTEADVLRATRSAECTDDADPAYSCQATELPKASEHLSPYDLRQYIEDYTSGNVTAAAWLRGVIYITYESIINAGIGLGRPLRWFYDRFQKLWGGLPYPRRPGMIPTGQPTPTAHLNLQPGEWVRVKSYEDILATCNTGVKNRGMGFDGEQVPYCGGTYRVLSRVSRILNERTGKMMHMQNPCIILEDVYCQGRYSYCRMFCPRAIYSYWREIWLERVEAPKPATVPVPPQRGERTVPVLSQ